MGARIRYLRPCAWTGLACVSFAGYFHYMCINWRRSPLFRKLGLSVTGSHSRRQHTLDYVWKESGCTRNRPTVTGVARAAADCGDADGTSAVHARTGVLCGYVLCDDWGMFSSGFAEFLCML